MSLLSGGGLMKTGLNFLIQVTFYQSEIVSFCSDFNLLY